MHIHTYLPMYLCICLFRALGEHVMALLFLCPGHVYTQDPKRKPHTLGSAIACWWPQRTLLLQLCKNIAFLVGASVPLPKTRASNTGA